MLLFLDNLLRDLFKARVPALRPSPGVAVADAQVGVRPPDDDWRAQVASLGTLNALNIYLIELRENRALRSNERYRREANGKSFEGSAPARLDCHYLITAWSPGQEDQIVGGLDVGRTVAENEILYQVAAALLARPTLLPSEVYAPNPVPAGIPAWFANAELPMSVLPGEGFPKYAEFWGTMGGTHPWKPCIYLVVTLPVALPEVEAGGLVTTIATDVLQGNNPATAEAAVTFGGRVLDATGPGAPAPVADAWVRLETAAGATVGTAATDASGRFVFGAIRPGSYRLRWRDGTRPEPPPKAVQIPGSSADGELIFA